MNSRLAQALLVLTISAAMGDLSDGHAQDRADRWHNDLERGRAAARTSGKPLFVVFRCVR